MATRKVPAEGQAIFDKYCKNFVRRLKKDDALKMFEDDFNLTHTQASDMFDIFDKDRNGTLSIWEYQQFYTCIGSSGHDIYEMFGQLGKDDNGNVDISKAWDKLKTIKTANGGPIGDEQLLMFMKTAAGEHDKAIDFPKFVNLVCRIKISK